MAPTRRPISAGFDEGRRVHGEHAVGGKKKLTDGASDLAAGAARHRGKNVVDVVVRVRLDEQRPILTTFQCVAAKPDHVMGFEIRDRVVLGAKQGDLLLRSVQRLFEQRVGRPLMPLQLLQEIQLCSESRAAATVLMLLLIIILKLPLQYFMNFSE